jgi:hypothetical protein
MVCVEDEMNSKGFVTDEPGHHSLVAAIRSNCHRHC